MIVWCDSPLSGVEPVGLGAARSSAGSGRSRACCWRPGRDASYHSPSHSAVRPCAGEHGQRDAGVAAAGTTRRRRSGPPLMPWPASVPSSVAEQLRPESSVSGGRPRNVVGRRASRAGIGAGEPSVRGAWRRPDRSSRRPAPGRSREQDGHRRGQPRRPARRRRTALEAARSAAVDGGACPCTDQPSGDRGRDAAATWRRRMVPAGNWYGGPGVVRRCARPSPAAERPDGAIPKPGARP